MGAMATAVQADDKTLHVYNWSDYIAPDTIANFEKQTGIKVVYDVFDSNETLEAKLLAGKSGYDVVVPSNNFLAKQIKAGVYRELDRSKLPNWKNWTKTCSRPWAMPATRATSMPSRTCGARSASATTRRRSRPRWAWTRSILGTPCSSLRRAKSSSGCLDAGDPGRLGKPSNSTDKKDLKAAEELFLSIRPSITYFHSSKYISDLANGNICVAVGYSGDRSNQGPCP